MTRCVVVVDPRVPDLQTLLDGLAPGALAFVLAPTQDGVRQIADILAADTISDVSTLALVGHGRPGAIELGSTTLDEQALADNKVLLARMGATLAPDADVLLYACDVAAGAAGQRFVSELSRALGDVAVGAASHAVGSAQDGGSWTLDAATAPMDARSPFTMEAQASYQGVLAVKFTKQTDPIGDTGPFDARTVFGDFDSDGDVDILYQNGSTAGTGIGYKKNNGNGTFTDFTDATAAGTPFTGFDFTGRQILPAGVFVQDINNDGRVDIVDRTANSTQYWQQNSNGTFTKQTDPIGDTGAFDARMVFGDFDSDGDIDILYQNGSTAGAGIGYKQNNGSGTFTDFADATAAGTPFTGFDFTGRQILPASVFVQDINNDGRVDIVDRTANSTQYWQQNSNGTFTKQTDPIGDTGAFDARMVLGDFDSDGDVDILYQNGNTAGAGIGYKQNNGSGTFTDFADATAAGTPFTGFDFTGRQILPASVFVQDIDHDRDVDIVDRSANSTQYWQQGSSSGGNGSPPALASTTPADNATGVAPNANIVLTFDESVSKGTGNIEIVRISDNAVIQTIAVGDATVTGSGTTWTINPPSDLAGGVEYGVRIAAGAFIDTDGAIYAGNAPAAISFTTLANVAPTATNLTTTAAYTEDASSVALNDIVVTDPDTGETITATLTLSTASAGVLTTGTFGGTTTSTFNAGVWTVTGSVANVNLALAAVAFTPALNFDQNATITTRIRDAAATGPADGTISLNVTAVNDTPTATNLTTTASYTEDAATVALDNIVVADPDTGETITATLTLNNTAAGVLTTGTFGAATSTYTAGTGIWTVSGSVANVNLALAAVAFTPAANFDQNTTITTRIRDAAATGPADGAISLNVTAVNDPPTVTAVGANPTFTEGGGPAVQGTRVGIYAGGATVSPVEAGQTIIGLTFTVSGVRDGANEILTVYGRPIPVGATSQGVADTSGLSYTVTESNGTAAVTIALSPGVDAATASTLVGAIAYQNTSVDNPTAGNRVITLTGVRDSGGTANAGVDTASLAIASTVTVVSINDAPTLTGSLAAFVPQSGSHTLVASELGYSDPDDVAADETFTVSNLVNGTIKVGGVTQTSFTGTQLAASQVAFLHDGGETTSASFSVSVEDGNQDNSAPVPATFTLTVGAVNAPPTLTATGLGPTFTEGAGAAVQGAAVALFSNTAIGTVEAGQTIKGLTFTVSGLADGANETIRADGTAIALTQGTSGVTAGNSLSYAVSVAGTTATVTLTSAAGVSTNVAAAVVNGLDYQNTNVDSPTAGNRTVTLTSVQDSGGISNNGADTTSLSIASNASVTAVNDAPTITSPANASVTVDVATAITGISFADVDAGSASVTVTLGVGSGSLTATSGNNVTVGGTTSARTLTGSITSINAFIAGNGVTFQSAPNATAPVTLSVGIDDGGATGSGVLSTATASVTLNVMAAPSGGGGGGSSTTPTSGPDQLAGTSGDDTITGLAGDDTITGSDGNDLLYGNQDNDNVDAGSGNNTVYGGFGNDSVTAGAGNDLLFGNEGADTINAGDGNNTIVGGQDSADGADRITSGSGNDLVFGNGGNDVIAAGGGNDTLVAGFGDDVVLGNQGDDFIYGNEGNDLIVGGMGDDTLIGGQGDDTLYGSEGNDVLFGNEGADRLVFGTSSGIDIVNGFSSSEGDRLDLMGQTYTVTQNAQGAAVLTLSGGGVVTLTGIAASQVTAGFFA